MRPSIFNKEDRQFAHFDRHEPHQPDQEWFKGGSGIELEDDKWPDFIYMFSVEAMWPAGAK